MMRRRAPRACHSCRHRKVKCDVSSSGVPCRNCSRSKAECSVSYARKRRLRQHANERSLPLSGVHTFEIDQSGAAKYGNVLEERSIRPERGPASGTHTLERQPSDSPCCSTGWLAWLCFDTFPGPAHTNQMNHILRIVTKSFIHRQRKKLPSDWLPAIHITYNLYPRRMKVQQLGHPHTKNVNRTSDCQAT